MILRSEKITKRYKSRTVAREVSVEVKQGEIVGLLGPNGAGKTTTIQMLLGTLTPTSGSIAYFGEDFAESRIAALKRVGYASGYDKLPARLTVTENLDIVGRIYGLTYSVRMQQIEKLLKFFGIWEMRDQFHLMGHRSSLATFLEGSNLSAHDE